MNRRINPFIISGYEGAEYFCDRVKETKQLCSEIANGNNVALIATRRMGKSGLIRHCFSQAEWRNDYYTFFIDIYDTKNLDDFTVKLSKEIVDRLRPYGIKALKGFLNYAHSLQAGISFTPSGDASFNVQVGDLHEGRNTLDEIFRYLEDAEKPCIIAIDEFQQIANYPETNIEATLRTYIQNCHNAQFIFAGSQRHVMSQMFTSASRPFFQSVSIMHLDAIDELEYDKFARRHFEKANMKLAEGVTQKVYELSKGVTWYTQKLFNTLFAYSVTGEECTKELVPQALEYILTTQEYTFKETLFRLPEKQKLVLTALAREGNAKGITSSAFLKKYHLPSASTVQSAVKGLLEKDFITYEQGTYSVYDLFLANWIKYKM